VGYAAQVDCVSFNWERDVKMHFPATPKRQPLTLNRAQSHLLGRARPPAPAIWGHMQPHTLRLPGGEPLAATPRCTFPVGFMRSCGHICVLVCLCGCVSCRGQHLFPCPPLKRSCDSRVFVAARHESWQFGFKSPSFPFSIPISPACCTYLCSGIANTHACTPKKKWLGLEIGASRPFNPFNS